MSRAEVEDFVLDALDECAYKLDTQSGLTKEEITEALSIWPDFQEAWLDYIHEGGI